MKCSLHIDKKYSIEHNLREYDKEKWNTDNHIDYSKSHLNIVLENKDLQSFFSELFDESIAEFNEKNKYKHPERVIDKTDFYNKHKKDVREAIIQVGNEHEQLTYDEYVDFYAKALKKWESDNPTFKIFSAVIHCDETTPHLHIDYLPVTSSNRGLKTKISLDGALNAIGYKREKKQKYAETPFKRWLSDWRASFEQFSRDELHCEIEPAEHCKRQHSEYYEYHAKKIKQESAEAHELHENALHEIRESKKIKKAATENYHNAAMLKNEASECYKKLQNEIDNNNLRKRVFNLNLKMLKQENDILVKEVRKFEKEKSDFESAYDKFIKIKSSFISYAKNYIAQINNSTERTVKSKQLEIYMNGFKDSEIDDFMVTIKSKQKDKDYSL